METKLIERILSLEQTVEILKRQLNNARGDKIYLYFHNTKSIRLTSEHFNMKIPEVIQFITDYDNCVEGVQLADDFTECNAI